MTWTGPFVLRDQHGVAQPAWRAFLLGEEAQALLSVRRGKLLQVLVDPVRFEPEPDRVRVALTPDVSASMQTHDADPWRVARWLAELRPLLAVPEVVLTEPDGGPCRFREGPAQRAYGARTLAEKRRGTCHSAR